MKSRYVKSRRAPNPTAITLSLAAAMAFAVALGAPAKARGEAAPEAAPAPAAPSAPPAAAASEGAPNSAPAAPVEREIGLKELEDKIRGGWAGQMIGVSLGTPTEFRSLGKIIEGELPWTPDFVKYAIKQDDLYVDMTFAEVMDKFGIDATTEQFGDMFRDSKYHLWHANAGARRLLQRGIKAPLSGDPRNNIHANDIDFQIESDFIGLMTPGMPNEAIKYCDRVGRVMNYGDGLYGGMFVTGAYAAAFFEKDPRKLVEAGLACLPPESGYAKIIRDVLDLTAKNPGDWRGTWKAINDKWDNADGCPTGALHPFNIDARLNGSYVALGLIAGAGDFTQTVEITTRLGQDSDCNPSNAGGIIGAALGWEAIPDKWKSGIPPLADEKFIYTNFSLNGICESTKARALKVVESAGGRVEGDRVHIKSRPAVPPALEQWGMGRPKALVPANDPAFSFDMNWRKLMGQQHNFMGVGTNEPGREMEFKFTGVGAALLGPPRPDGGAAEMFVDGKKVDEVNLCVDENTHDNCVWHTFGLPPGEHVIKLTTKAEVDPRSQGKVVIIESAIVYE